MLVRIILASSKVGDVVLDPFSGTGTTSLVAMQLRRKSVAIEKASRNVRCIKSRIEKMRDIDRVGRLYDSYKHTENLDEIWGSAPARKRHRKMSEYV